MRIVPASSRPPVVWSIAGLDTAGGAGLSADQRAADALGVHLCPVAATLTAQHSRGVQALRPLDADWLDAQLRALAHDMPPAVIKTGLLGSVEAVHAVARWVDWLRDQHPQRPLALVVDPVLAASAGGSSFTNDAILDAYQRKLLPRATLITPNRAEARRLLGLPAVHDGPPDEVPELAARLLATGVEGLAITGGDAGTADALHSLDWIDTPQAQGWLCGPRVDTPHHHGSGCTFAMGAAAALALGHTAADALVLAKMLAHHALQHAHAAGEGPGPVQARRGFAVGPAQGGAPLPWLGLGRELPWRLLHDGRGTPPHQPLFRPFEAPADGLYGITSDHALLASAVQAGLRCLQLRHKAKAGLAGPLQDSLDTCARAGARLFVNDHWREALALLPPASAAPGFALGLHLGQEDLLALGPADRQALRQARDRVMLGLSSHSLWELARAAGCGASLIACGPVQATTTKDMPWRPQGEDNLRWWVAHSPAPVVAIGGLLTPQDAERFSRCGPAAVCVVRGLGDTPEQVPQRVPALRRAVAKARQALAAMAALPPPHPVL